MDEDCKHGKEYELATEQYILCMNCSLILRDNIDLNFNHSWNTDFYLPTKKYTTTKYFTKTINTYDGEIYVKLRENQTKILSFLPYLDSAYEKIKDPKRKKSLNVHYKLYKLLRLCNVDCKILDFKIPFKTKKKIEEHKKIWKEICDINKW